MEKEIVESLRKGESLSLALLEFLVSKSNFEKVLEKEGVERPWGVEVTTVYKIGGELYAVEWEKGLTSRSGNYFNLQPRKVKEIGEREITIVEKVIIYEEEE